MSITYDQNGFPILLTENGSSQTIYNRNQTSGDSNGTGSSANAESTGSDPYEAARRSDAIREVARRYKHGDTDGVIKYLEGRITRPLTVDELNDFHNDVHNHRINDLIDILDHSLRGSGVLTRSYRAVKVSAPGGWVQTMLENLSDDEVISVVRRLKHRGHELSDINKFMLKRITKERFAKLEDKFDDDAYELNLSASGLVEGYIIDTEPEPKVDVQALGEAIGKAIASSIQQPEIKVEVPVHIDKTAVTKRVIRDEKGLVKEIIEEDGS